MKLEQLEPLIRGIARRYSSTIQEIEDYEQIARLEVWQLLQKNPNLSKKYISIAVSGAIKDELKKRAAQKRIPRKTLISLETKVGEESRLIEVIGKENPIITKEELLESIFNEIRSIYGKSYIKKIRDLNQPKKIVKRLFRTIIENLEAITPDQVPEKINYKFFVDRKLEPLLWVFYKNSPFKAIRDIYGNKILPWKFKRKPLNFWKGKKGFNHAIDAMKWFTKVKNLQTISDCRKITSKDFEEQGLSGMLARVFNSSPFLALKTVFPNLKPWQVKQTPKNYFNSSENQKIALNSFIMENTGELIEEDMTPEEVYELGLRLFVSTKNLEKAGFRGLVARYNNSCYNIFTSLFPGKILEWTLNSKQIWKNNSKEVAARAVRWLFEDYLLIPQEQIPSYASCDLFWRVGFSGIMTNRSIGFNSSPYAAVNNAYPGVFTKSDFQRYRKIIYLRTKNLKKSKK